MSTIQKGFVDGQGSKQRETRWLTPKSLVHPLGEFDLDPCGAPGWDLAKHTYLLENGDDGLTDPWFGRVWCNPPYGREAEPFLARMVEHNHGTALIFARTETRSFFKYIWGGRQQLCFSKDACSSSALMAHLLADPQVLRQLLLLTEKTMLENYGTLEFPVN